MMQSKRLEGRDEPILEPDLPIAGIRVGLPYALIGAIGLLVGEHTGEVLEWVGYTPEAVADPSRRGII